MASQPTLPAEEAMTEAELRWIEDEPDGLFPSNQDSNIGQIRKVVTDQIQGLLDMLDMIYENASPATAERYLALWESDLALTPVPSTRTLAERRRIAYAALQRAMFTRARRKQVVESFLGAAIGGDAVALTPSGVPLPADGVPLYSGVQDVTSVYSITEDVSNFEYTVTISNEISPDEAGLARELARITPAGINFTIVYSAVVTRSSVVTWAEFEVI